MSNQFDKLISSTPVNKAAARVLGRGVHWEPERELIRPQDAWQEHPLPLMPMPIQSTWPAHLAGTRVGRLRIVGYGGSIGGHGRGGGRWVVRCDCGMYGHQRSKVLQDPVFVPHAMCPKCNYLEQMKLGFARPGGPKPA